MKIKTIEIHNNGYVRCKSRFYSADDVIKEASPMYFTCGTNKLIGEIDSGNWAVSYLLSMYEHNSKDFILFKPTNITVNGETTSIQQFQKYSCYLDPTYPLFSTSHTIKTMIKKALKKSGKPTTIEEIRELFDLDTQRFDRPLAYAGNEIFRCMAAIGYANGKQVFCFPWLSRIRYDNYQEHMKKLLEVLDSLEMISIFPIGKG